MKKLLGILVLGLIFLNFIALADSSKYDQKKIDFDRFNTPEFHLIEYMNNCKNEHIDGRSMTCNPYLNLKNEHNHRYFKFGSMMECFDNNQ